MLPWILTLSLLQLFLGSLSLEQTKILQLPTLQWKRHHTPTCLPHKSKSEKGGTTIEMKHTYHWIISASDRDKSLRDRLVLDDIRVQSLQSRVKKTAPGTFTEHVKTEIPVSSGAKLQILNYIVTVEFGGQNMSVIVDTGSDLTWIQCQPCILCYLQQNPIYNPSLSPSYRPVPCNASTCNAGPCESAGQSGSSDCNYFVSYGDGSYTRGNLGTESLSLGRTPVKNFVFGCGRDNEGLFGEASGLIGFGRKTTSLTSQTSTLFGGVFSYCLPSSEAGYSGSLTLGGDWSAYKNSTPITYTRMVLNPQMPTFYFLHLTGISVGGTILQGLNFPSSGILIDSGTVITRLPPSIYVAVKHEFLNQFSGFQVAPGYSILDSCFNLTGYKEVSLPVIRLHFEGGADLVIDVSGTLYLVRNDASQACLAVSSLAGEDEIGIIGNYQQKNQRVIYDTQGDRIGFAQETCSFA